MERFEQVAKEKGFSEVVLWVLEGNLRAQGFYRSAGFSADGVSKSEYVRGSVVEEVRYVKKLLFQ